MSLGSETIIETSPARTPHPAHEDHHESHTSLAPRKPDVSGARKAAIFCLSLGEDAAAEVFKHLEEDEVQLVLKELAMMPNVKSEIVNGIMEEFNQLLAARTYVATGGVEYAKRLLNKSFGSEAARRMTDQVVHSIESPANFDTLRKTDPQQLVKLFQNEHPQTIAVVLAYLDPAAGADVIRQMPDDIRVDIMLRLANLKTVSQDVIKRISLVFNQKLTSVGSVSRASVGGVRSVAEICNRLDRDAMKGLLEQVESSSPELSLEIRNLMVTFEDILLIDDPGIREIIQRVDKKVLALALKGTVEELQERFFTNMSSRAVEMMKEEMDFMGQVKLKDVNGAQREIVEVLRELDEQGVISLGGGDSDANEYVS
jgi:flagellar motor switch protein FliG